MPGIQTKQKGKAKESAVDALGVDAVLEVLGKWANEKQGDEPLTVAVAGVTNVRLLALNDARTHVAVSTGRKKFIHQLDRQESGATRVHPRLVVAWSYYYYYATRSACRSIGETNSIYRHTGSVLGAIYYCCAFRRQ